MEIERWCGEETVREGLGSGICWEPIVDGRCPVHGPYGEWRYDSLGEDRFSFATVEGVAIIPSGGTFKVEGTFRLRWDPDGYLAVELGDDEDIG